MQDFHPQQYDIRNPLPAQLLGTSEAPVQPRDLLQGYELITQDPKRPHKHKDPTNHNFWHPPYTGPWNQNVRSLCLGGFSSPYSSKPNTWGWSMGVRSLHLITCSMYRPECLSVPFCCIIAVNSTTAVETPTLCTTSHDLFGTAPVRGTCSPSSAAGCDWWSCGLR